MTRTGTSRASRWSPSDGTTSRTRTSLRSGSWWPAWPRSVSGLGLGGRGVPALQQLPLLPQGLQVPICAPGGQSRAPAQLSSQALAASGVGGGAPWPARGSGRLSRAGGGSGTASLAGPVAAVLVAEGYLSRMGGRSLRGPALQAPQGSAFPALLPHPGWQCSRLPCAGAAAVAVSVGRAGRGC